MTGRTLVEAYRAAGYTVSDSAAYTCASRLFRSAQIQAAHAELRAESAERVGLSVDELLRNLKAVATFDRRHYKVQNDGVVLADGAPSDAMLALERVSVKIRRKYVRGVFLPVPPNAPAGTQPQPAQDVEVQIDFGAFDKIGACRTLLDYLGESKPLPPADQSDVGEHTTLPQLVASEDASLPEPPPAEADEASGGGTWDLTD